MAVPGYVANPAALDVQDVKFQSGDTLIDAVLARPREPGLRPGLILIHESLGLNQHMRELAGRFANAGYIVVAPDLYARVGSPESEDLQVARAKLFSLPDEEAVRDLEAAADFVRAQPGASDKVGCVGFSSGGRHALLLACSSAKVDAAVDGWGTFIERATPTELTTTNRPVPVIDMVTQLRCPLFAAFGAEDTSPSPEVAEELRRRVGQSGKQGIVKIYADAGHGFLVDHRPSYREQPALELWTDMLSFFDLHLRASNYTNPG